MVHKTALQAAAACVVAAACFIPLRAHAVDTILTPQQTAALLGTSCTVEYYNSRTGVTTDFTADLVGSTLQSDLWTYNGWSSVGTTIPYNTRGDITNAVHVTDTIYTAALIYRAYIPNYETEFVSSAPSDRVNLSFDFSINISGLSHFRTVVYPSVGYGTGSAASSVGAYWQANTSLGLLSGAPLSISNRYRFMWMFWGDAAYTTPSTPANARTALGCFDVDITGDDFALTSFSIGVQRARVLSADFVAPDYGYQQEGGGYYYYLVQCPIIDARPATTTAPVTGVRPATTPANTVDLETIESQQRVQIEIENDNRNYTAGVFDGINIIIEQLNKIYDEMKRRGDIVVNVETTLGTDLVAEVGAALSSYTTPATMPTFGDAPQMAVSFWDWLQEYPEIYTLMIVGLTLCLAKFIIFRGNAQ